MRCLYTARSALRGAEFCATRVKIVLNAGKRWTDRSHPFLVSSFTIAKVQALLSEIRQIPGSVIPELRI